ADFKDLALSHSTDNLTFRNGGELAEFGIGRYDPAFESAAFSLAKDGDISRPVETPYGVHLIRRLQVFPVSADPQNALDRDAFRQRVTGNERLQIARKVMTQKIFTRVNYKKAVVDQVAFQRLSDSVLAGQPARYTALFKPTTPLFTYGQKTVTVAHWVTFLESVREQGEEEKNQPVADLLDRFTEKGVVGYYRDHLENFSADFAAQVREFKEGNLLFEIMQKKIWDVATQDTQGLKKYFEAHANRYWWEPSADVILITANSDSAARRAAVALQADPSQWREWVEHSGGALQADSGRFELSQLPIPDTNLVAERKVMPSVKNEVEKMVLFCYIFKLYPQRSLRSFTDARGLVINDYQNYLEEQWLQSLKKKYPVVINEPVVRSLLK
ncbi:MAG: peptidylprolyl isomerase, partial [Chitinophagaceae bacterium]